MNVNTFSKEDTQKIKGIAIILMMIHHCFLDAERYAGYKVSFFPLGEELTNYWALFFKICVGMFVFITGYGLTLSFQKVHPQYQLTPRQTTELIMRRYSKLISGFMYVLVLIWIYSKIAGTGWFSQTYGTGRRRFVYAFIDLLGLGDLFGTPMYISTFWYMSLAQLLIFVMPLLIFGYRKLGGVGIYALTLILPMVVTFSYKNLPRYAICATLGMICADKNLLGRIKTYNPLPKTPTLGKAVKCVCFLILIAVLAYLRQSGLVPKLIGFWDSVVPMTVIAFCFEFIINIPILRSVLSILGKYSMYIFLIHNFIRYAWYSDFLYGFYYAPLIVVVLLALSLGVAFIMDTLRKLTRFDQSVNVLIEKCIKALP